MKKWILPAIFAICLIAFLAVRLPMHRHQVVADEELQALLGYRPRQAELVGCFSLVGLIYGNGNHCDIVSIAVWRTRLPFPRIEDALQRMGFSDRVIACADEAALRELAEGGWKIGKFLDTLPPDKAACYITYSIRSLPPGGDIRCY